MEKHSNLKNKKVNKSKNQNSKSLEKNALELNNKKDFLEKNALELNNKKDFLEKNALELNNKKDFLEKNALELNNKKDFLEKNVIFDKNSNKSEYFPPQKKSEIDKTTKSKTDISSEKYSQLKYQLYKIIFESDTKAGKLFDVFLIIAIVLSVIVAFFDSLDEISFRLYFVEWFFTIIFTIEYLTRVWIVEKPLKYVFSFFGIIDLLSILPAYISLFITGTHYLMVVRVLRILRVFRIFKLGRYLQEANVIVKALKLSLPKIVVFMTAVATLIIVMGSIMYIVEGPENGFTSIPKSIYWAIVTITTVGYGDIAPKTPIGQAISALVMIAGYSIIAIPTGIVSAEFIQASIQKQTNKICQTCSKEGHDVDAKYCKYCGNKL